MRLLTLSLSVLLSGLLGVSCSPTGPKIVRPADGAPVVTPAVQIQVELPADAFDPATLAATLNGAPVALAGGPLVFTASVGPGAPLAEDNLLVVTARGPESPVTFRAQRSFGYAPPRARARRISSTDDLVQGPLAHSRLGDWLLENDVARFVIQDAPQRDLYAVGQFGGNLIDAELRSRPGLDNFMEIQPAVSVETVIHAQTVEIVNDGANGLPAVIRSCGPDDTLDFVNISSNVRDFGFQLPANQDDTDQPIEGCTEYVLSAGDAHLTLTTTITNLSDQPLPLFVGDYVSASGEVDAWMQGAGGIGDILTGSFDVLSWIGYGEATGVDYHLLPIPYAGALFPRSDFVTTSGVTVVAHSFSVLAAILGVQPGFVVPALGQKSYTQLFGVGDGSGSNGLALSLRTKGLPSGTLRGCVTVGGAPGAGARVAVGSRSGNELTGLTSQYVTGADGCYEGPVPPGSYGVAAARAGTPYQGGGAKPFANPVTIVAGATSTVDIALPATGRVVVDVTDAAGDPVPARVAVLGFDPSPEQLLFVPGTAGLPSANTGYFNDATNDRFPFGFAHVGYAGSDGHAEFDLEPGTYQLAVSRGTEWSLFQAPLMVAAGAPTSVAAQIAQVVDSAGFISSDYHVHGIASADSRVARLQRVMQFAGEGVDNLIMTDHHVHTDQTPVIAAAGLTPFLHATVGEEITSWDTGHYNGYPFLVDPTRVSGGSTDWARSAPAGQDFKQYGAYAMTPAEIHALATTGATATPETVVQINHIDSHFGPLQIDSKEVPPQSYASAADKLEYRIDPASGNLYHHFPALELWNGADAGAQNQFVNQRMGVWFNLLNQGLRTTAIADTDTHEYANLHSAGARTWTPSATDAPAAIDPQELGAAVKAGRAVGGQGVYVQARLRAGDGSDAVADFDRLGSTHVASLNGAVTLEIDAQAPAWAPFDVIEIYANAPTIATGSSKGTPVSYRGTPERVLTAGVDFTVASVPVAPGVPDANRLEAHVSIPYTGLSTDTWFVVVVRGSGGVSRPMFPVYPKSLATAGNGNLAGLLDGNLGEGGTLAFGFTNALYADVDGTPGFQAPLAPAAE